MLFITASLLLVISFSVQGANILLNKPSEQSSTHGSHVSEHANDGSKNDLLSGVPQIQNPYWQGDLLGFYSVASITVTSASDDAEYAHLHNTNIGVSVHDISCQGGEVTACGKWPNEVRLNHSLTFNCTVTDPVRFVRIWREGFYYLALSEVEVEGTAFENVPLKKVTTPTTSLSVPSVTGCGTMCHKTQPCVAFSYSPSQQPNCLLGPDNDMTSDNEWNSYKINKCMKQPTCHPVG